MAEHRRQGRLAAGRDQHIGRRQPLASLGSQIAAQLRQSLRRQPAPRLRSTDCPRRCGCKQAERLESFIGEAARQPDGVGRQRIDQALKVRSKSGPAAEGERLPGQVGRRPGRATRRGERAAARPGDEQSAAGQVGQHSLHRSRAEPVALLKLAIRRQLAVRRQRADQRLDAGQRRPVTAIVIHERQ